LNYQREFVKRINVAMVGIGSHSYRNLLPTLNYLPVRLKAVCNKSNVDEGRATAAQYGCAYYQSTTEMYDKEDIDAVFICVSPYMHPKLAIEAFDAGLHVWIEKPVAARAYEVEEMLKKRKDRIAVVGFKKVFMPATQKALEIVGSERYGRLASILGIYPMSLPENGDAVLREGTFTNWLGNGCHPLSLMMAVGGQVGSVTAYRGMKSGGICILEFQNGVIGNFHMASGPQPIETYHFYSENWHLEINNGSKVILQRGIPSIYGRTVSFAAAGDDTGALVWEPQNCLSTLENKSEFVQGIYGEMNYFCNCILENKPAKKGSLEFALEVVKVYEAALLSEGKPVTIQ
jgi:predicted dehydrogenase